jgi:hypothetical protein
MRPSHGRQSETVVQKQENTNSTDLVFASGRSLRVSIYLASFISQGDQIHFALPVESRGCGNPELLIKPGSGHCVYQAVIGYAAKPRTDKMAHPYVQADIPDGHLGFSCLHLPCAVVRDYFYRQKRNNGDGDNSIYGPQ